MGIFVILLLNYKEMEFAGESICTQVNLHKNLQKIYRRYVEMYFFCDAHGVDMRGGISLLLSVIIADVRAFGLARGHLLL